MLAYPPRVNPNTRLSCDCFPVYDLRSTTTTPLTHLQAEHHQETQVQQDLKQDAHGVCLLTVEGSAHRQGGGDLRSTQHSTAQRSTPAVKQTVRQINVHIHRASQVGLKRNQVTAHPLMVVTRCTACDPPPPLHPKPRHTTRCCVGFI